MLNMAQKWYSCSTWPVYSLAQLKSEKVPEQTQEKDGERAKKETTERKKETTKNEKNYEQSITPFLLSKICLNDKRK